MKDNGNYMDKGWFKFLNKLKLLLGQTYLQNKGKVWTARVLIKVIEVLH